MVLSKYLQKKILDSLTGKQTFVFPTQVWVGLSFTNPLNETNILEPTKASGYKRILLASEGRSLMSSAMSNIVTHGETTKEIISTMNNTGLMFQVAISDWSVNISGTVYSEIPYYVIYDSQTYGNILCYGKFEEAIVTHTYDIPYIGTSKFKLTINSAEELSETEVS